MVAEALAKQRTLAETRKWVQMAASIALVIPTRPKVSVLRTLHSTRAPPKVPEPIGRLMLSRKLVIVLLEKQRVARPARYLQHLDPGLHLGCLLRGRLVPQESLPRLPVRLFFHTKWQTLEKQTSLSDSTEAGISVPLGRPAHRSRSRSGYHG